MAKKIRVIRRRENGAVPVGKPFILKGTSSLYREDAQSYIRRHYSFVDTAVAKQIHFPGDATYYGEFQAYFVPYRATPEDSEQFVQYLIRQEETTSRKIISAQKKIRKRLKSLTSAIQSIERNNPQLLWGRK